MRKKNRSLPILSSASSRPRVVVVAGTGSSLTREDAALLDNYARDGLITLIAIQDNYAIMPHAQFVYGCDYAWWNHHYENVAGAVSDGVTLLCADPSAVSKFPLLESVICDDWHRPVGGGLSGKDGVIRTGYSSGHQATHYAYNLRPETILLAGLDYQGDHWFGRHPSAVTSTPSNFRLMLEAMNKLAADIAEQSSVKVLNCSPASALTCFPNQRLEDALREATTVEVNESESRDLDT